VPSLFLIIIFPINTLGALPPWKYNDIKKNDISILGLIFSNKCGKMGGAI